MRVSHSVNPAAEKIIKRKHLLGLEEMDRDEILLILETARVFKQIFTRSVKKVPTLRGKTVVNLFFENSTRTRTSFEIAAKRLSADVVNFNVSTSSVVKGETLVDTARTIEAMGADFIIMRHSASGAPWYLSQRVKSVILNAGDGTHEHPTQGLLDMYTILEHKKKFEGLKVVIVGDIIHSRVARSNIWALTKLGANVTLAGPRTLVPPAFTKAGVNVCFHLREAIRDADVINLLRIQLERQQSNLFPSMREYRLLYQINDHTLSIAKPDVLIMHPGPINRGVEISQSVADGPHSVINEQVTNGVAVRMAVLYLLSGAKGLDVDVEE